MRVCPNCGHHESPIWRKSWNKRFTDYCKLDEVKDWEPEIFKRLKVKQVVQIQGYRYYLSSGGYVTRIHKSDCAYPVLLKMDEPEMESGSEKVRRKLRSWSINQAKLEVFAEK